MEVANGQELEDHLDSRSHWGILEHIQQSNAYDDLAIAFLQVKEDMVGFNIFCDEILCNSAPLFHNTTVNVVALPSGW